MSSCDLIADQLAALNAELTALRQENFVTRYEFEQFKRLTNNGEYLLQNANFRDYVDGIIDSVFNRDPNRFQSPDINQLKQKLTNVEKIAIEADITALKARDKAENNFRKISGFEQKINGLKKEFDVFKLGINNRIKGFVSQVEFKAYLTKQALKDASQDGAIKLLQTGLAKLAASIPFIVKSVILSLIATGVLNAAIQGAVALWSNEKISSIRYKADVAFDTALKAFHTANRAENKATEATNKTNNFNGLLNALNLRINAVADKIPGLERAINLARNTTTDISTQIASIVESKIAPLVKTVGGIAVQVAGLVITVAVLQRIGNAVLPRVGLNPSLNPMPPTLNPMVQPTIINNNYYNTTNNTYPTTNNTTVVQGSSADISWIRAFLERIDRNVNANLTISGIMNNKLGAQIRDGLSGWMNRFTNWSVLGRLMEFMTLAATIHNAMMLSNNLTTTLISSIQNVVNFLELKDSEGKGYDVSSLLKQSVENFLKSILGAENYTAINTAWKNANRIYQSAGNLLNSMLSFGDIVTQALQLVAGQTSKIGNALRIWGTVGETAYGWMNPNPNFSNPILIKLNNLNEAASVVEEVSQQPQSIKDAKKEVSDNAEQLAKDIGQAAGSTDGKIFPEAARVKTEETTKKVNSPGQEMEQTDLEADE